MQNPLVSAPIVLGVIDLDLQHQISLKSQIFPHFEHVHDKSQHVQVEISKFGPEMHFSIVKIPISF